MRAANYLVLRHDFEFRKKLINSRINLYYGHFRTIASRSPKACSTHATNAGRAATTEHSSANCVSKQTFWLKSRSMAPSTSASQCQHGAARPCPLRQQRGRASGGRTHNCLCQKHGGVQVGPPSRPVYWKSARPRIIPNTPLGTQDGKWASCYHLSSSHYFRKRKVV